MLQANQFLREVQTKENIKLSYIRLEMLKFLREQDEKGYSGNGI